MSELLAFENRANSYLLCTLEGILLGVEALAVRELLPLPWVTPIREAPPLVAGVVNVRGVLVPILDLNAALGLPPHQAQTSDVLVLLQRGDTTIGIVVSEVRDVRPLTTGASLGHSPFSPTLHRNSALVAGMTPVDDEIAQLLRLDTLLKWGAAATELENIEAPRTDLDARSLFESASPTQIEIFRERARNLNQNFETALESENEQIRPLAAFALDGEYFGLDLSVVREFSLLRAVAPVPCSPAYIVGLMNLRGETLTLINISSPLGLSRSAIKTEKTRVVVVQCEGLRLGIVVDEVLDIISVNVSQMAQGAQSSSISDEAVRGVVRGTVFFREKMLGVLDLSRLLQSEALAA